MVGLDARATMDLDAAINGRSRLSGCSCKSGNENLME